MLCCDQAPAFAVGETMTPPGPEKRPKGAREFLRPPKASADAGLIVENLKENETGIEGALCARSRRLCVKALPPKTQRKCRPPNSGG